MADSRQPKQREPNSEPRRAFRAPVALVCSLFLAQPAPAGSTLDLSLPELGNPSRAVVSEAEEFQIGERFFQKLLEANLVDTDPVIASYVENLGIRLATAAHTNPSDFTFFTVKDKTVNAFAAPGGFIGVHHGLILTMRSEAELAAVVSHEIAHVTQRHLVRHYEASSNFNLGVAAAILAGILLSGANSEAREALVFGSIGANASAQVNFTRENEKEADRIGIGYLQQAGYPGAAMAETFRRLHELSRFGGDGIPEFLRSHPVNENRIAEAQTRATPNNEPAMSIGTDNTDFAIIQAIIRNRSVKVTADGIRALRAALADGRYVDEYATRFELASLLHASGQNAEAVEITTNLLTADNDRVPYHLLLAQSLEARGQSQQALERLQAANEIFPGNLALRMALAEQWGRTGEPRASYQTYRRLSQDFPRNAHIRDALSRAAFVLGRKDEAYLEQAEAHLIRGQTEAAGTALALAREQAPSDNGVSERIAQRQHSLNKQSSKERLTSDKRRQDLR
ncbi:MAG: M48 family metalloprotease [Gammaproteobacteria bacterium]